MSGNISKRISFWQLMADTEIVVPTIQRDYTYGSGIPATDKVLNHLLSDMHRALFDDGAEPLVLDFVYGVRGDASKFAPLDGQQRLTTLFLLHFYAMPQDGVADAERNRLRSFSYETRESTKEFCEKLTGGFRFQADRDGSPSRQIANESFFLPSFSDDPTICSMLVVLDRIHEVFGKRRAELWPLLTDEACRIQFDALDFGMYKMSDDLYIKMNARGKPLTEFEIFKSKFEKHISRFYDADDINHLRGVSRKFDVEWADLVLGVVGGEVKRIDPAFVNLFKNVLSIVYWRHPTPENDPGVKKGLDACIVRDRNDIDFLERFLDVFARAGNLKSLWDRVFFSADQALGDDPEALDGADERIRLNKLKGEAFGAACAEILPDTKLLLLYGWFKWICSGAKPDVSALRHLRNLIENSEYEIRAERMQRLFTLVDVIFVNGFSVNDTENGFNKNQWIEECAKAANPSGWKDLYRYENHLLLMGALSRFDHDATLRFGEPHISWTKKSLEGFERVFFSTDDRIIRNSLLSNLDYSVSPNKRNPSEARKRIFGASYSHWRSFFLVKNQSCRNQERLIEFLHDLQLNAGEYLSAKPLDDKRDWRYYFVRSCNSIYSRTSSGYYYREDQGASCSLEIIALNSTIWSSEHVAWKVMHLFLWDYLNAVDKKISEKVTLDKHGAAPLVIAGRVKLSIRQNGWAIEDGAALVESQLGQAGIRVVEHVCVAQDDADMIEYGAVIVSKILEILNRSRI